MHTNIFAVTAAMAATASAFSCHGNYFSFFNRAGPMTYQQIDPALFPGKQSPHLHSFDGGNAVSSSSDFATQMGSSCTTARIKPDKSLYWRPTLFWNGNNTGFHRVPEQAAKIYYKFGDDDSWANVTEFPEDFNMIAGDPFKRSDGDNPAGIRWACHQPDGRDDKIFTNGFPSGFTSCKYGFASEVTFPSCWNGEKLNPSKPNDHMAYPTGSGVGTEKCPTTHRVARFPTVFIEFWYDISSFDNTYSASSTPWVLSNGDPTGYGMHADFLNGWEKGVLGKATAETGGCNCGCGCGDDQMKECFGAENVNESSDSNWDQCAADTSVTTALFDKLPGCNPIQAGPARASVASGAGCSATAVASATSAAGSAVSSIASAAASAVSSAVNISISIPNKGYASDAYPTADAASSSPAEASSTPAAAESYSAPYPFPSGNSTVAPTATGQYSYSIHKSHGHNHSKFHHSKSTASPATPSDVSGDDADAEAASSCTASGPVTVTYTPTVTVSAKALAAAVDSTTVTTLTSYVTVTATATGY